MVTSVAYPTGGDCPGSHVPPPTREGRLPTDTGGGGGGGGGAFCGHPSLLGCRRLRQRLRRASACVYTAEQAAAASRTTRHRQLTQDGRLIRPIIASASRRRPIAFSAPLRRCGRPPGHTQECEWRRQRWRRRRVPTVAPCLPVEPPRYEDCEDCERLQLMVDKSQSK